MKHSLIAATLGLVALGLTGIGSASAADIGACLITKTDTNPFFVKMKEGATAKAEALGINLKSYAGKVDGDSESQVAAIETCIVDGARGILITASDTAGIVPAVQQALSSLHSTRRWNPSIPPMQLLQRIISWPAS